MVSALGQKLPDVRLALARDRALSLLR